MVTQKILYKKDQPFYNIGITLRSREIKTLNTDNMAMPCTFIGKAVSIQTAQIVEKQSIYCRNFEDLENSEINFGVHFIGINCWDKGYKKMWMRKKLCMKNDKTAIIVSNSVNLKLNRYRHLNTNAHNSK